jgi:pseudouridine synthase
MRLNKFLAKAGVASRRKSDQLIQDGTTTVNGVVVTDPAFDVSETDHVTFDGAEIKIQSELKVIILHKPKGYISTLHDPHGRKTIFNLIPEGDRFFPIGRLDMDTTGLLLITNDGELANYLMHPRNRVPKYYEVVIEGNLSQRNIQKIEKGLYIGDGQTGKAKFISQVKTKNRTKVILQLRHGKKREIRRLFSALKVRIFTVHRFKYNNLGLGDLREGKWRYLTESEIATLKKKPF